MTWQKEFKSNQRLQAEARRHRKPKVIVLSELNTKQLDEMFKDLMQQKKFTVKGK